MAVTDLTDSLPWWTRAGAGPSGGPGAAPQGSGGAPGGVGGQPPPGMNQQAWLQYLMQMFSLSSAQAAGNDPMAALKAAAAAQANGAPPQQGPGDLPVPQSVASLQPTPAPAPAGPGVPMRPPNTAGLAPGALSSANLGAYNAMPTPSGGGGMNPTAPPPPGSAAPGSAAPVPGPLAGGGAGGVGATSNPRFVPLDHGQNTDPTGRNRGPQMTALNLGGLFAGPMAKGQGGAPKGDNWKIDPNSGDVVANAPLPPTMPDDIRRQRAIQLAAARSGFA